MKPTTAKPSTHTNLPHALYTLRYHLEFEKATLCKKERNVLPSCKLLIKCFSVHDTKAF
jgi:hypothetical protein